MARFLLASLLILHGLIHLIGFTRYLKAGHVVQAGTNAVSSMNNDGAKILSSLWLATCLLFLATAAMYAMKKDQWWVVGMAALMISQILILMEWDSAKYGTIANIIVVLVMIPAIGSWQFNNMVRHELNTFLPASQSQKDIVTEEMLKPLPPVVQKWLHRTNAVGKEVIHVVHIKQTGEMRLEPDGKWMPVEAEQFNTIDKPGMIWTADVKAAPFIHMVARDKYQNGKGHMVIKLMSLFPVANSKGNKIDQGTLLRYLAEITWFPSAALSHYIKWDQLDANRAEATISYGGIVASGIFAFDKNGDVVSFEADRYLDRKEGATLEKWFIHVQPDGYKNFNDMRIAAKSDVTWKLKSGDFTWFKVNITELDYNPRGEDLVKAHFKAAP
jgi:hypothetical protein